ncbi:hypothetical protein GCM10023317_17720 [Actinopolymorpha pittospori]
MDVPDECVDVPGGVGLRRSEHEFTDPFEHHLTILPRTPAAVNGGSVLALPDLVQPRPSNRQDATKYPTP